LREITIGQYIPGNSIVHRLDPRTKIIITLAYMILLFTLNNFYGYIFPVGFILLATLLSGISVRYLLKGLKPLVFIITLTFLLNSFMIKGRVIYELGPFDITYEGLSQGAFMAIRLILLITGTSLLTLTTSPISLTDGIERLLSPFKKIGVPAHELAMMMTIALRFIPTLLEETDKIMKAQMARGADFVMLGRALIADPEWPEKARTGRACEIRRCISCMHGCYGNLAKSQSIQCVLNPEVSYESILSTTIAPAKEYKYVVIVGGGIAGMQAAITAYDRGHKVTLLEAENHLGGQLNIASVPPHKHYVNWAKEWFTSQVAKRDIDIRLGFKADLRSIKLLNPDLVLVATGSLPCTPPIPGIENGVQSWDLLSGKIDIPKNKKVAVLGGGTVGCETAELLATHGNKVTIFEMLDQIACGLEGANMMDLFEVIKEMDIKVLIKSKVTQISTDSVVTYENEGEVKKDTFDFIVLAFGQKSHCDELTQALEYSHMDYRVIGDAANPSNFQNATSTAYFAALDA
jgi:energy-coupling factor transport system permease protein